MSSLEVFPVSEVPIDTKSASRTSSRTRTSTASTSTGSLEFFSITETPLPSSTSSGTKPRSTSTKSRSTTRRLKVFGTSEFPLASIPSLEAGRSSSEDTQASSATTSEITQSPSLSSLSSQAESVPSESSLSDSSSASVNPGMIFGVVLASLVIGTLVMIFLIWRLCVLKKANRCKRLSGQWFDERKYAISDEDGGTTLDGSQDGPRVYRAAWGR
ncbi:hypothetical protein BDV98DRAFT_565399 [Pterulicium gracile]|uniref:Uncharacterized protein n=1 Tax=Pterulicium gracile TaxID=1884261 RepID=A0A5C3QMG3_9AGAR|nr:hypothetical protein BDV98DRAFT_565399 [Pterula gracilis]